MTGELFGTPSAEDLGTFSRISISLSVGGTTESLPPFSITVTDNAPGSATLSWVPPTQNTNGTQLFNLAGYRIYYGTNPGSLTQSVDIGNPGIDSYVVDNLSQGTWYFKVKAYSMSNVESDASNVASKTVL